MVEVVVSTFIVVVDSAQLAQRFLEGAHFLRQRNNIFLLDQMTLGTALRTDAVRQQQQQQQQQQQHLVNSPGW